MTASVLRSRMLRKHPKRTLSFSEARRGLLDDLHDAAKDGKLGPQAQSAVDTLDDLKDHPLNVLSGSGNSRFSSGGNNGQDGNGNNNDNNGDGNGNNGGGRDNTNRGGNNNNGGGRNDNNGGGSSNGSFGGGNNGNNRGGNNGNSNNRNAGSNNGGSNSSNNPPFGVDGNSSGNSPAAGPFSSSGSSNSGKNSGGSTSDGNTDSSQSPSLGLGPSATSISINTGSAPSGSPTLQPDSSSPPPTISIITATTSPVPSSVSSAPSSTSTDLAAPQANLSKHSNRGAIAGGVVGALVFIFLVFAAWMIYKRRRKDHLPPSAEFMSNPPSYPFYPFARAGFGNTTNGGEKNETPGGKPRDAGTGAAGQAKFKPFGTDSAKGIFSEKRPQVGQYPDAYLTRPLPATSQPEVLYATPARISTSPNVPAAGSTPGTPTTPSGRRIPFGTGTFQFPPRPPQTPLPRHGGPP